jgi:hypothetical protein
MGMLDFVKDAGESCSASARRNSDAGSAAAPPTRPRAAANDAAGDAIVAYIKSQNLSATSPRITTARAPPSVSGWPPIRQRWKDVLCCGNVAGLRR